MITLVANVISLLLKAFNQIHQQSERQLADRVKITNTYFLTNRKFMSNGPKLFFVSLSLREHTSGWNIALVYRFTVNS